MKKIEFEIRGLNYEIEDITIQDYYNFRTALLLEGEEAEFELISKLSKCSIELLKQISLDDWRVLSFNFNTMISIAFTENPILVNQFNHLGVEYGLLDWDKITIGEFADLDVIATAPDADNKLHEILAILYRPIVKKKWKKNIIEDYDYDGFKERCELFLSLPMGMVKAVIGFFLHIAQISLNRTKESLMQGKKTDQKAMAISILTTLQDSGGLLSYTSQVETRSKFNELLLSALKNPLTLLRGSKTNLKKKKWNLKKWFKNIIK
jgi:hypothetical protein